MKRELARLISGQIFLHACMTGMRLATPLLALQQGYSAMAVGVLLALFSLTQVFMAIPAGRFTDRHGLKKPVRLSVVMACLGAGLAIVWPIFPVLCFGALTTGGATGITVIALQRHVGRMASDANQLKETFSWLAIGPAISNFMGPFFAGLLIDHAGSTPADASGFRAAFIMLSLMPLVAWYWIRKVQEKPVEPALPEHANNRVWDLLHAPLMRRLLLVNWLLSSCWDVHTFVVPVLGHERGLSASVVGTILGSFAVASAMIRVVLPWIARRLQEYRLLTGAMVCASLIFAVYPLFDSALAMGICSVSLGLVLGVVQPMIMSTLHQITPDHRQGEALGLRIMTVNASSVIMPLIFGAAGAVAGVSVVFWVVGTCVASGIPQAWRLRPQHAGHPH
ncbi:MAG: MFS transporter [Betaproteobacteria bacterium]|nr:MFS transporter [Betaproteobacteria bacterium]NDB43138.1 MFS transporter [Betaproteobacteria bacterium]NDD01162.1 MFS transporter [Betaproteobacteria bacterium]NDD23637.1 MFS transporter [Betaproteobacteria bacterium]NDF78034.1 MFS transporter [Betaproteobacteria bacterium]